MAHDYLKCKTCGAVWRTKDDTSMARMFGEVKCVNLHCGGTAFDVTVGKSDTAGVAARQLADRMVKFGKGATTITGQVKINYVTSKKGGGGGAGKFEEMVHNGRDLKPALERLVSGAALPTDVNNRNHVHDGGKYRGQHLPIGNVKAATTYYKEYGVLSSSRGWEINLSSERLVVGACSEIYYSSLHYQPGWWWVFSPDRGVWSKFELRP